jgi:PleD family two-component response regulator
VSEFGENSTPATVFEQADKALYRAKEEGRNRCKASGE